MSWQKMDSAPRDGEILGADDMGSFSVMLFRQGYWFCMAEGQMVYESTYPRAEYKTFCPVWWMPIPNPPAPEARP